MIVITGSVQTDADNRAEIERLAVAHCRRSRAEPGCIAHNVHADLEEPERLVFVEVWADGAAVKAHFAVPESGAFVGRLRGLAKTPPTIEIYDASAVPMAALAG